MNLQAGSKDGDADKQGTIISLLVSGSFDITSIMFESSAPDNRLFSSSPSDIQPTNEYPEDKNSIRVEKGSSADSDAYTPSNSTLDDGRTAHPAPQNNLSLAEIASQDVRPFDAETLVIHPIMAEESTDEQFFKGGVEFPIFFAHIIHF